MLAPNTLLQDRYLVMRLLGQGGMGAVYQATDRKFGNAVALKETFYSDPQLRKAFSHEARLLNRLRHAALPVVMDYFAIGERQFLVMQYIPGKDLEQLLNERKAQGQGVFVTSQVLRWADQLLDALEYLHSQNPPIIHRDIKPQNLKLTPRGEVILLDFGLAKGIVTHQSQVSQSIRGYTPNYASLEQIRGTGTDARSDIYSIGATIYHLLTGEMPQDALTRIAAILMGQPDPLKSISTLNPAVPDAAAQVIEKAMSAHPDQRYSSAAAMRQALRSAAINTPPVSLHRAQTLTDEPLKVNVAAADARMRAGAAVLQQAAPAAPVESSIPDHIIILLDNIDHKTPEKNGREKDRREQGDQAKNIQENYVQARNIQERNNQARNIQQGQHVQARNIQERNGHARNVQERNGHARIVRGDDALKKDVRGNNVRETDIRGKEVRGKEVRGREVRGKEVRGKEVQGKEVRGKEFSARSFFLRKVARENANWHAQRSPEPRKAKTPTGPIQRKPLLYGLAAYILITLTICVLVYKAFERRPDLLDGAVEMVSDTQMNVSRADLTTPLRFEALRYYLEVAPQDNKSGNEVTRATGLMPLEGGTKFKFHFKVVEGGYLYIIALGKNGVPQTFLTSQPMPASGVTTNWSDAGADFHFPDGGQWFMIQKDAENTPFTVILSKSPLQTPAFLTSQSGRDLNPDERQQLMELRKQYAGKRPELVATRDGNQPTVVVQSATERAAYEPIIFDISIKRK